MKTQQTLLFICTLLAIVFYTSCNSGQQDSQTQAPAAAGESATPAIGGQASVKDDESQKNIVKVAVGSADHSTLVAALKAGSLVDALANAGPFTVFAPTNAAFDKLPGTVDNLLKPENVDQLKNILQYHVTPGVYKAESLKNGQKLGMVNGQNATVTVNDGKIQINGANVVASVRASNGVVHVVDAVLLPPQ